MLARILLLLISLAPMQLAAQTQEPAPQQPPSAQQQEPSAQGQAPSAQQQPVDGAEAPTEDGDIVLDGEQSQDEEEEESSRFIPTEEISQDLGVSFPVDI